MNFFSEQSHSLDQKQKVKNPYWSYLKFLPHVIYAEWRYANFLSYCVIYAECPIKADYAERHYAECRYPKCRGAIAVASIRMTKATKVLD